MSFSFQGRLQASKSLMNRALLLKSFEPGLLIDGDSDCEDVRHMKQACVAFERGEEINCGEAGTVLRFMALRASREPGEHVLRGSTRLFSRPQSEIPEILSPLGVQAELHANKIVIRGQGWKNPRAPLRVSRARSSQFASGVVLSAWNLDFDLHLDFSGPHLSDGYWQMTLVMLEELGLSCQSNGERLVIPAGQRPHVQKPLWIEPDYSSLFAVTAAALVNGEASISEVPAVSQQPDAASMSFLERMRAPVLLREGSLQVKKAARLGPLRASFLDCPDLVPVMAALCSFAEGESILEGAPQLVLKESNRLLGTHKLLEQAGVACRLQNGALRILGRGAGFKPRAFRFNPDQDHRMAMAAALFKLRTPEIEIETPEVVRKSFPEFWSVIGL